MTSTGTTWSVGRNSIHWLQISKSLEGMLTRTPQGWLRIEPPAAKWVAVQFPCGSVLAENGNNVDIPDVGTLHLGDSFSDGGGDADLSNLGGVPAECQVGTSRLPGGRVAP